MELPYNGRATIIEDFDHTEIIIPAKKNWFVILFFSIWICGWAFGEFSGFNDGFGPNGNAGSLFMIVWLSGWTVGGFFALRTLWWMLLGKEIITVGQGAIIIDKKGALFYKSKTYDLREAKEFRAQEDPQSSYGTFGGRQTNVFNLDKSGTIRFDYGMQTVKFGEGLDEAEANYILQKLRNKKLIN